MSKIVIRSSIVVSIVAVCLMLTACPKDTENAANGVHAYLVSLQTFQKAEIQLHGDGKISNHQHIAIQEKLDAAQVLARHMDRAILAKEQGQSPDVFIDEARNTFSDVLNITNADPQLKQELQLVAQGADDALKNAITLINAIRSKPSPSRRHNLLLGWLFFAFAMPMFAVGGIVGAGGADSKAQAIYSIIQIALQMEPIAAQALADFLATKGKDTEAILALNVTIEDDIHNTAQEEIKNTPKD